MTDLNQLKQIVDYDENRKANQHMLVKGALMLSKCETFDINEYNQCLKNLQGLLSVLAILRNVKTNDAD